MKIITIANRKGGVGKTTTVYNLGFALAAQNKKVCLLDLDSQGNLTKTCNSDFIELADFLKGSTNTVATNIDIISACNDFLLLQHKINQVIENNTFLLNNLVPLIAAQNYDYLLVDTSPSLDIINTNAFIMSDLLLLVIHLDYYSLLGLNNMLDIVGQVKALKDKSNARFDYKILVNSFHKNRVYNNIALENLNKMSAFTNIFIPYRQSVKDNISSHKPSIDTIAEYGELCKFVM